MMLAERCIGSIFRLAILSALFLLCLHTGCCHCHDKYHGSSHSRTSEAKTGTFFFPGSRAGSSRQAFLCNLNITVEEGWIYSPNYPSDYNNSVTCHYRIHRFAYDVCEAEVTFTDFDLEDTAPQCTSDYLEIDGTRMCGIIMPDTKKKLKFRQGRLTSQVIFQSDYRNSRKGFMAKIRQLRNSCTGTNNDNGLTPRRGAVYPEKDGRGITAGPQFCDIYVGSHKGQLRSPNWPYGYKPNAACVFTLRRAALDVCRVDLILKRFDVSNPYAPLGQCSDYLELPDRRKVCGYRSEKLNLYYPKGSNFMVMMFRSDYQGAAPGFEIDVQQVPNSCGFRQQARARKCDMHIKSHSARIASPNYPWPYQASDFCVYMVEPAEPSMCYFSLEFNKFDLGRDSDTVDCSRDYFQLPDGSRVCNEVSGKKTYMFPRESNRIAMFYFSSDQLGSGPGYDITVRQISCEDPLRSGVAPSMPRPVQPSGTSSPGSIVSPYCDRLVRDHWTFLTSPNYPEDYSSLSRCSYSIERHSSDVCQVRLQFVSFDIEKSSDCRADYLDIEPTQERLCGRELTQPERIIPFPSKSDYIKMSFVSDEQVNRPGFKVRVEQMRDSCRGSGTGLVPTRTTNSGSGSNRICFYSAANSISMSSEGHPNAYKTNIDCVYRIYRHNSNTCGLEVDFVDFSVGSRDGSGRYCSNDFLEIEGVRYCGYQKGESILLDFPPHKDSVDLRFRSDQYQDVYPGFLINVRQLTVCGRAAPVAPRPSEKSVFCGEKKFHAENFQIISPGYEVGRYKAFTDCHYTIKKSSFDVCALEVQFLGFGLEQSNDCFKDYLQIGEMKVCGKLPYQTTRTYEFGQDELMMKFHADGDVEDVGFFVSVKQIKC